MVRMRGKCVENETIKGNTDNHLDHSQTSGVVTYSHEVLVVPGLQLCQRTTVQQESVGNIGDEFQRNVALKTRH